QQVVTSIAAGFGPERTRKMASTAVDSTVEWNFAFCSQQKCYGGVGVWLKDAGRGLQGEIAKIAEMAKIGN
ncbi:MAG TPA: hypothetical protein VGP65_12815, partial [Candidatus Angelobacter sp.]|nr:hypothetical protein [Candidatus Angelobacter sp.]